jgi:hypothetical protein
MTGYRHPSYAASLAEFGEPRQLPSSGGWILIREVPGHTERDAMGCYPLFACENWAALGEDLDALAGAVVSLALVPDPFGDFESTDLEDWFSIVRPFKQRYVVDLASDIESFVSQHHRRNARRALERVTVERCAEPQEWLDTWDSLYGMLVQRHGLRGIHAFSRAAFAEQLAVPGLAMFRAENEDGVVAMTLWYVHGDVAHYHLGATTSEGYDARANFALFWRAIETFAADGVRTLDLGGGAGVGGGQDGLTRFKEGWSTGTVPSYFCGKILDPPAYDQLSTEGSAEGDYFPAYRRGEFA